MAGRGDQNYQCQIAGYASGPFGRLPTDLLVWAVMQAPERISVFRAENDPVREAMLREATRTMVPFARRRAGAENDSAQDAVLPALPFQAVRCPTLILHGTRDTIVPFSHAEAAHAQIPGSRLVSYDAGHTLWFAKHREVAAVMDAFLAGDEWIAPVVRK
jgi:pimeloyl-ACP methyl ester carboxylesterase